MIAPYSTIYQILHSRPDNGYNHKQSRFIIQLEATFDRNINVDFKDKCLQIVNTCFKFKLWVFSLLTLSHQQQAAHSSQRAKHQQSNQSTISLSFWPFPWDIPSLFQTATETLKQQILSFSLFSIQH